MEFHERIELLNFSYKIADNPFPLDHLNKDGNIIENDNDYEPGLIAEGSVTGMGIQQLFDNP